ncbi:hypothetical protein JCM6882_009454 [Rhodosporidiobolus microsporus]
MTVPLPLITPIIHPPTGPSSARPSLGATITSLSLSSLFDPAARSFDEAREHPAFKAVEEALYKHKVVVIKGQEELGEWPERQFEFVRAFDPAAGADHGHNDATASHRGQKSLLYGIGNSITGHPEVKLVGGGKQGERFGGKELQQADHTTYHKFPLSHEEREAGLTRWHRWHMDASLFRTSLPLVTSLLCLGTPSLDPLTNTLRPPLTVQWTGVGGEPLEMRVLAGATGFVEGERMWELLPEGDGVGERGWCEGCVVEYAPWPYQWSSPSRGNSNGLGTYDDPSSPSNNNTPLEDLPPYDKERDVKRYPMVWTCPRTGRKGVQVHPVAVLALHPPAPSPPITDLSLIRAILNRIQQPALVPENIWAPGYEEGDVVVFDNRAVYHSATDYPESWGTRTMLQAHVAASFDPR